MEGKNVNETIYMVGYTRPDQFNRKYKRQCGVSPSVTLAATGA